MDAGRDRSIGDEAGHDGRVPSGQPLHCREAGRGIVPVDQVQLQFNFMSVTPARADGAHDAHVVHRLGRDPRPKERVVELAGWDRTALDLDR